MSEGRSPPRVLIVDDDLNFTRVLGREIERMGFQTVQAASGGEAAELLGKSDMDVTLLDIRLCDENGIDVLRKLKELGVSCEIVMLTGHGTVENAIEAMKAGAFDFVTKPCKLSELEMVIRKAVEARRVQEENRGLRQYLASGPKEILTRHPGILMIIDSLPKVAQSDAPVLILGESGTGKELIARRIHQESPQRDRPFIAVNCAVLQNNLLESELFGHERGAFTGAVQRKRGLFEIADGGAIFLDEIGEIDEGIQAKLLRALQFGEFRRVGGNETRSVRVRVIAATNRNLEEDIREKRFRQDLFFRLNVVQIIVPPLRERVEDIELLTERFLQIYGGKRRQVLMPGAIELLRRHGWPGNVRELENVVRRLLIFHEQEEINREAVLAVLPALEETAGGSPVLLEDVERKHILRVLTDRNGDKKSAAEALGISLKTLYNKLHAYGWKTGASSQ